MLVKLVVFVFYEPILLAGPISTPWFGAGLSTAQEGQISVATQRVLHIVRAASDVDFVFGFDDFAWAHGVYRISYLGRVEL